jgi:Xaa-Pro aminopeptidase
VTPLIATLVRAAPTAYAVEPSLTVGDFESVRRIHGPPTVAASLVEQLRRVKDPLELAALERACSITVAAFAALAGEIRVGDAEVALARRLEQLFGELGAEDRAFDSIVGSGPHSAIPHHEPGARGLGGGDLLVIDAGARVDGYHADMTRTFVVAAEPAAWQAEVHAAVAEAQQRATAGYLPGAEARAVHALARATIADAGLADAFTHGLGHGVGLRIHEAPMIGERSNGTLEADMAITVEPGVYLPGRGGVRIEDTLVVTDAGPRILTEAPRGLAVVG